MVKYLDLSPEPIPINDRDRRLSPESLARIINKIGVVKECKDLRKSYMQNIILSQKYLVNSINFCIFALEI